MCLLSHFRLFATAWTVACQASPSIGFSRQEYWSGLPFPPPGNVPHPEIEPVCLLHLLHCRQILTGLCEFLTYFCMPSSLFIHSLWGLLLLRSLKYPGVFPLFFLLSHLLDLYPHSFIIFIFSGCNTLK